MSFPEYGVCSTDAGSDLASCNHTGHCRAALEPVEAREQGAVDVAVRSRTWAASMMLAKAAQCRKGAMRVNP